MGINGLLKAVKEASKPAHIKSYAGKRVAIDAFVWLHRGSYGCAFDLGIGRETSTYVDYFMYRLNMLLYFKITPVVVFDGAPLPAKRSTQHKRREARQKHREKAAEFLRNGLTKEATEQFQRAIDITPKMVLALIKTLRENNIEYIVAPYEADAQLAFLDSTQYVHAIITEDSDLIAFGCSRVFFKMTAKGDGFEFLRTNLAKTKFLKMTNWQPSKVTEMCVLSGCDYVHSVPGIGLSRASALLNEYKSIDAVLRWIYKYKNAPEDYEKQVKLALLAFRHQRVFDPFKKCLTELYPLRQDLTPEEDEFIGRMLPAYTAYQLALGNLDPSSLAVVDDYVPKYDHFQTDEPQQAPPPPPPPPQHSAILKPNRPMQSKLAVPVRPIPQEIDELYGDTAILTAKAVSSSVSTPRATMRSFMNAPSPIVTNTGGKVVVVTPGRSFSTAQLKAFEQAEKDYDQINSSWNDIADEDTSDNVEKRAVDSSSAETANDFIDDDSDIFERMDDTQPADVSSDVDEDEQQHRRRLSKTEKESKLKGKNSRSYFSDHNAAAASSPKRSRIDTPSSSFSSASQPNSQSPYFPSSPSVVVPATQASLQSDKLPTISNVVGSLSSQNSRTDLIPSPFFASSSSSSSPSVASAASAANPMVAGHEVDMVVDNHDDDEDCVILNPTDEPSATPFGAVLGQFRLATPMQVLTSSTTPPSSLEPSKTTVTDSPSLLSPRKWSSFSHNASSSSSAPKRHVAQMEESLFAKSLRGSASPFKTNSFSVMSPRRTSTSFSSSSGCMAEEAAGVAVSSSSSSSRDENNNAEYVNSNSPSLLASSNKTSGNATRQLDFQSPTQSYPIINQLLELGNFTPQQAMEAIEATKNRGVDAAADWLLQQEKLQDTKKPVVASSFSKKELRTSASPYDLKNTPSVKRGALSKSKPKAENDPKQTVLSFSPRPKSDGAIKKFLNQQI